MLYGITPLAYNNRHASARFFSLVVFVWLTMNLPRRECYANGIGNLMEARKTFLPVWPMDMMWLSVCVCAQWTCQCVVWCGLFGFMCKAVYCKLVCGRTQYVIIPIDAFINLFAWPTHSARSWHPQTTQPLYTRTHKRARGHLDLSYECISFDLGPKWSALMEIVCILI